MEAVRAATAELILAGLPGPADARRGAPRCARGCGSWTARSSTGSSTATSTRAELHALLLRALEGALGEPL